jgi:hypothetical protein
LAPEAPVVVKKTFNAKAVKRHLAKPRVSPPPVRKAGVVIRGNVVRFINSSSRGKKCVSFKKGEVVARAKKLGITGVERLSKEKICVMIKNAVA